MKPPKILLNMKEELGLKGMKLIPCRDIRTASWTSLKCQFGCREFGQRHSCPPSPPPAWISEALFSEYQTALLVHDDASWRIRWAITEIERKAVTLGYYRAFGMGSGPCQLCEACPPQSPCIKSTDARPSMEAMGIDVFSTVEKFGYQLLHNSSEPQFFGLVLIE